MNAQMPNITLRNAFNGETFIFPMQQDDPTQLRFIVQLDPGGSGCP